MSPARSASPNDRRAIAALFAVFALLVQALIPAAAMAASPGDPSIICTATGVHASGSPAAKPADSHGAARHGGFAGMPCQDCLAAALAVVATAPVTVQPVAYETARVEHAPAIRLRAPCARGPPRPFGQGPPTA